MGIEISAQVGTQVSTLCVFICGMCPSKDRCQHISHSDSEFPSCSSKKEMMSTHLDIFPLLDQHANFGDANTKPLTPEEILARSTRWFLDLCLQCMKNMDRPANIDFGEWLSVVQYVRGQIYEEE